RISLDPSNGQWKVHHQIARDGVHVRADSGFSETAKIVLSIPAETVIPLRREPPVDVITVSHLKSTSVRSGPRDSVAVGIPREKARALQTDVRAAFLSRGANSQQHDKTCKHNRTSSQNLNPPVLNV